MLLVEITGKFIRILTVPLSGTIFRSLSAQEPPVSHYNPFLCKGTLMKIG
jgi:hypothetical protein